MWRNIVCATAPGWIMTVFLLSPRLFLSHTFHHMSLTIMSCSKLGEPCLHSPLRASTSNHRNTSNCRFWFDSSWTCVEEPSKTATRKQQWEVQSAVQKFPEVEGSLTQALLGWEAPEMSLGLVAWARIVCTRERSQALHCGDVSVWNWVWLSNQSIWAGMAKPWPCWHRDMVLGDTV